MKIKSGIYCIKNKINNKRYIGSSTNISNRWSRHRYNLNKGVHATEHLLRSWKKYGSDNFEFIVMEYVEDVNLLLVREQFWIDLLSPEYNKRKIAENNLGYKMSEEQIQRRIDSGIYKNRIVTEETRKRMSEAGYKRDPMQQETKDKMSLSKRGISPKNLTDLHIKSRKKVYQYKDGVLINEFDSISDATEKTNILHISCCCHGRRRTSGGFSWSFIKE